MAAENNLRSREMPSQAAIRSTDWLAAFVSAWNQDKYTLRFSLTVESRQSKVNP